MYKDAVLFTKEMKKDYTILIPNMLPIQFKILAGVFKTYGYNVKLLETSGRVIPETGLKYVHNDTCYPAILVIGQFIHEIQSGGHDPNKVALMLMQTGGGCRASNYISLLRKALAKAGYPQVPVISLNFNGIEKHPGFKMGLWMLRKMMYALLAGDLLMCMRDQCVAHEINKGETEAVCSKWTERIALLLGAGGHFTYRKLKKYYAQAVADFDAVKKDGVKRVRVGVVGEIYVKFSPLGNNNLDDFLLSEGAEVVVPGVMDFIQYCVWNGVADAQLYGTHKLKGLGSKIVYRFILGKQLDLIKAMKKSSLTPMGRADFARSLIDGYIGVGAKMGEGWLLTAEMLELIHSGVTNIVCTQPFGCLPNHISGV